MTTGKTMVLTSQSFLGQPTSNNWLTEGVWVSLGHCNKRHRQGSFNNRLSSSCCLGSWRSTIRLLARSGPWWKLSSRSADGCLLSASSHSGERRSSGLSFSYKDPLIPSQGTFITASQSNHLPKASPPNSITQGLGIWQWIWEGHNIQFTTEGKEAPVILALFGMILKGHSSFKANRGLCKSYCPLEQ